MMVTRRVCCLVGVCEIDIREKKNAHFVYLVSQDLYSFDVGIIEEVT